MVEAEQFWRTAAALCCSKCAVHRTVQKIGEKQLRAVQRTVSNVIFLVHFWLSLGKAWNI